MWRPAQPLVQQQVRHSGASGWWAAECHRAVHSALERSGRRLEALVTEPWCRAVLPVRVAASHHVHPVQLAGRSANAEERPEVRHPLERRQAESVGQARRETEPAVVCRGAAVLRRGVHRPVAQGVRQEAAEEWPSVLRAALLSEALEEPPWVPSAAEQPSGPSAEEQLLAPLAAALSDAPCPAAPSADRVWLAPSGMKRARRWQIAKRKMQRSRAISISVSSCRFLVVEPSGDSVTQENVTSRNNGLIMVRRECGSAPRETNYFAAKNESRA